MGELLNLTANGNDFSAYEAKPENRKIKGGLIIIHEVWGLTDHIKDIANRFAAEGYVVLAPNLLSDTDIENHMTPEMPRQLFDPAKRHAIQPQLRKIMAPLQTDEFAESTMGKLTSCFDNLFERAELNQQVGVVGFCFGGTYSFRLSTAEPRLKAAVPFYGHADFSDDQVAQISCPILAFYGKEDAALIEALPKLTKQMQDTSIDFSPVVYPDSQHAFFNDTNPLAHNKKAAADAWRKTIKFLDSNLAS